MENIIRCCRCGYEFNPNLSEKVVIQFKGADGDYFACEKCLEKLGAAKTEDERERIIKSFKKK